jgi:uncharacterized membrane protein (DUF4010 family)
VTDRAAIRTDILYTLIHRLGLFRLAMFFLLAPLMDGSKAICDCWAGSASTSRTGGPA